MEQVFGVEEKAVGNVWGLNSSPAGSFILRTEGTRADLKGNEWVMVTARLEPGLAWANNGVTERKGYPGLARLEGGGENRWGLWGRGGWPPQEVPCPSSGPRDPDLSSVRCQEMLPQGLIASGRMRLVLGSLCDPVCISRGPVVRHLCWTRRSRGREERR